MEDIRGKTILLAGDHAGFALKDAIAGMVRDMGGMVRDFGPDSPSRTDFPKHVAPAAQALANQEGWRAILIDGAGYPSGILANKFPGVYAAVANDSLSARLCREHTDANALCLGGQVIGLTLGKELAKIFLTTSYDEASYGKRVGMVKGVETENFHLDLPGANVEDGPVGVDPVTLNDVQTALRNRRHLFIKKGARLTPSADEILKL